MKTKCFIINYNRVGLLHNMLNYLSKVDEIETIVIDNNSTYLPLLEYYKNCNVEVLKMDKNYGYKVFWDTNLYNKLNLKEDYIITDSDLDLSEIPFDFLNVLKEGLDKYKEFNKCGFSLKLKDLPNTELCKKVSSWENQFWQNKLDDKYYIADIDTTFSLCKYNMHEYKALRTAPPYCAKHVPWYYTDFNLLPEDEQYYFKNLNSLTHWSKELIKL